MAFPKLWRLSLPGLALSLAFTAGCRQDGLQRAEGSLSAVLAEVRPGEGRLVGAPCLEPTQGRIPRKKAVTIALQESARALEKGVTVETLRVDAVVSLLAGDVDRAIDELTKAGEQAPMDATIWSDLAAAHLQRNDMISDPYELVLALAATNRAIHLNPSLHAARFNRALALEHLSLRDQAKAEWQAALFMERDRLWANEARNHSKLLERQVIPQNFESGLQEIQEVVESSNPERARTIVSGSPQSYREYLEETLFPIWATAETENRRSYAAKELAVAKWIADALVAIGGDQMSADVIDHVIRDRTSDPKRFRNLIAGFLAYSQGLKLASSGLFSTARPHFREARELLASEGSPFAYWAAYRIALCHYQGASYQVAYSQLLALTRNPATLRYKALQGRSLLLIGLIDGIEGRHTASINAFKAAEAAFSTIKEAPYTAKVNAYLAMEFDLIGQRKEAWHRQYLALTEPASFDNPGSRFSVCEYASWLARREGETEIALWFLEEVVKNAPALKRPDAVVVAMRQHAELLVMLGRKSEAAEDLAKARSVLQQISEQPLRRIVEGDLLLAEAEFAAADSPRQAIAKLDESIPIFRATSNYYRIGYAFYLLALAEKALGKDDDAERDLAAAIAESERQRETIVAAGDRISYLDRQKELFDTMIELQLDQRKRPDSALRFSEQAKARVLWDWMLTRPAQKVIPDSLRQATAPLDLPSIQRSLPEGTVVVEYAVLPRKTILWVLRRQGEPQWQAAEIGAEALGDLVQRLRRALPDRRSAEVVAISQRLYDVLIRPVLGQMAPGERLVLIPDGMLHTLPFALLRDRHSGRYLIQDHACAVAPSARVFAAGRRRDAALARGPERILVAAAPDFDPTLDPTLLPLKSGATDASIAQIFPGSRALQGPAATREAFLQAARDFEILHFGGHSVINADFPLLSRMLFAKSPKDPNRGVLYSGDILEQHFPRTRLAVLASCSTAAGRISRTEGVESLARPFLAAGVPTVIAALWNVDDQVTADFFVRFYHHLARRFDVAGALQATQLESLAQGADPKTWAAFEVIGGGAQDAP